MLGSPCGSPSYQGCVRQGKIGVRDWVGIYLKVTETFLSELSFLYYYHSELFPAPQFLPIFVGRGTVFSNRIIKILIMWEFYFPYWDVFVLAVVRGGLCSSWPREY